MSHSPLEAWPLAFGESPAPTHARWAGETLRQIEKDFGLHGLTLQLPEQSPGLERIASQLARFMEQHDLLNNPSLKGLLYQIDLPETALRAQLAGMDVHEAYKHLAVGIIKRCFAKVYWRNTLRS